MTESENIVIELSQEIEKQKNENNSVEAELEELKKTLEKKEN